MTNRGHFQPGHHTSTEWVGCQQDGHVQETYTENGKTRRRCRTCNLARARRYAKERHLRRRLAAIEAYGGKCACCGESELVFLAIDHIGGGGNLHRREINASGSATLYRWLEKNDYPDGFRVLCHNCNYAIHYLGECPHAATA